MNVHYVITQYTNFVFYLICIRFLVHFAYNFYADITIVKTMK